MSIEAMKQALEALEHDNPSGRTATISALRAAIEQAQEPVAWMHKFIQDNIITHNPADINRHPERWTPLYTAPRQWQGLTDEELDAMRQSASLNFVTLREFRIVARAVEAKLKEMNG